ncbi:MAG: polyhydroxyalkanoate synthesis regulator DNA-binding domain-containing protein [Deltaproteobacteria bacterium]|nr:polyhydroxyalkanoate synthesis regulator DNA-binding domain-containing protein [Deltaproteobacteria bacterium]MCB9785940.1 polyhydroxyalkanoate synthesis regulator DNA-binding domain-containing protein [Deltaproteobacteria bacterium]
MAEEKQPRVIKRYANRKLYDMSESCYITHDEIARLVRDGEEVRIIDNRTKEDLTTLTLTQILFKEEKNQRKTLPLHTLRGLLQTSGDFIQRHITQPVTSLREEAEDAVTKVRNALKARAELEEREAVEAEASEETEEEAAVGDAARQPPRDALREWLENSQRSFESLQRNLEERWELVFSSLGHLDANRKRIRELEARVEALEARLRGEDADEPTKAPR